MSKGRQPIISNEIWIGWPQLIGLPFLILGTSFLTFLADNHYKVIGVEILICIGGLSVASLLISLLMYLGGRVFHSVLICLLIAGYLELSSEGFNQFSPLMFYGLVAGMVALSWSMKEGFFVVITYIFLMMVVVAIMQWTSSYERADIRFSENMTPSKDATLPRVIHLVLDEHIGIEGLPKEFTRSVTLKKKLKQFYSTNQFALFGGAYSHYFNSYNSIANFLNLATMNKDRALIHSGDEPYRLTQNKYFQMFSEKSYKLNILGANYIDFCEVRGVDISNCFTFPSHGLQTFSKLKLPWPQKLQVVASRYLLRSTHLRGLVALYNHYQQILVTNGFLIPPLTWFLPRDGLRMHPLNTDAVIDGLWEDIVSLPPGNMLFAHLLIPHHPYVLQSSCTRRLQVSEWKNRYVSLSSIRNSDKSRGKRYQLYLEQIDCLYEKLNQLFEKMKAAGIFDNSIIIIHGDHGSRIVRTEPTIQNEAELSKPDLWDGFSTLFAVKLPGQKGFYDPRAYPLEYLLQVNILSYISKNQEAVQLTVPYVYLKSEDPNQLSLKKIPYPMMRESNRSTPSVLGDP